MKYIYLNLIALFGFVVTYLAFHFGYFLNINNFVSSFPRNNFLVWLFFLITDVGGLVLISIGFMFLIALLALQGKYRMILYTLISLLGGLLSQTIIKNLTAISRPESGLVSSFGYSFPSGHANMTAILFLSFCFYVFNNLVNKKRRRFYYFVSIAVIILVGLSRLYLNVHWVSDVLAGWCLGLFWATVPMAIKNLKSAKK